MTPRLGVAAATAVLALVLSSCADSEEPAAGGGADAGSSDSPAPSESASESSSASPSESPEVPEVAPATGPLLKVKGMRVNAPKGWETTIQVAAGHGAYPLGQTDTYVTLVRFPNSGLYEIDELADEEVGDMGKSGKRLDDLQVDGMQVYHLVGSPEKGVEAERFGTIAADQRVALLFFFGNDESRAEKDEVIQSMLATMQLG